MIISLLPGALQRLELGHAPDLGRVLSLPLASAALFLASLPAAPVSTAHGCAQHGLQNGTT